MGRQASIGNPPIAVELRRSARSRRMSLRVSRLDGRVTLTLPQRVPEAEGLAFLAEREGWLRGHLGQIGGITRVGIGAVIPVEGRPCRIEAGAGRRVEIGPDRVRVPGPEERAGARLAGHLKALARDRLAAACDAHAAALGRPYGRITLRDTRSRWGSCSSKGDLMFTWRLILAPPEVLDYVAAHEVAHLAHMDHSAAFWAATGRLCPAYRRHRAWLKDEGDALLRLDFG
ncbi:M48 family metallopeptidase [Wenxinia saemankumensis]|nr:SprT family zinc-dependent metalloprotease [Wenxinia saemankumensis]